MLQKGFLKPHISVNNIGKTRFWAGVFFGLAFAFLFSYGFNYLREGFRSISIAEDLYTLSEKDFRLYDLFYAFFASALGMGITLSTWFYPVNQLKFRRRYYRYYTVSTILFILFFFLGAVTRYASIFPVVFYTVPGYDNQIDLIHDFWPIFVLIPLVLFFLQWNTISLNIKTTKWFILSFLIFLLTAFCLFKTTTVDRNILKTINYNLNKEKFDFIEVEFQRAAKEYNVSFSKTIREILEKQYAERTKDMVDAVSGAFGRSRRVPLDTLILQKILIHNLHKGNHDGYFKREENYWDYAFPEQVYEQIKMYDDINVPEVKLLFEILHEERQIVDVTDIDNNGGDTRPRYEINRLTNYWFFHHEYGPVYFELRSVIEKLRNENQYQIYHHLIPALDEIMRMVYY